jgi:deoxyribose-phosphate aldolase
MLHAILEYRLTASEHRGIKAAGGIKTMAGAMLYYALYEALIPEPPSPGICRLGASSLAYELVTHYDSICQKSGKKSELAKAFKGS